MDPIIIHDFPETFPDLMPDEGRDAQFMNRDRPVAPVLNILRTHNKSSGQEVGLLGP
jgi:hypothetical protein